MAHPGGRPTKYSSEILSQLEKYLSMCGREQTELPTKEGFGLFLGINEDTLVEWEKIYPEFSVAIKKLVWMQRNQLINDGLYGGKEVNPGMAIFLLKANHGMIETSRQEFTGPGGEALRFNFMLYGHNDPIQLRPEELERAGVRRIGTPGTVQSPQLAPEGQKDNTGSQSTN